MCTYAHISLPLWRTVCIVTLLSEPKEGQGSWMQTGKVRPHKSHFSNTVDIVEKAQAQDLQHEDVHSCLI